MKYNKWVAARIGGEEAIAGPFRARDMDCFTRCTGYFEMTDATVIVFILRDNIDQDKVADHILNNKKLSSIFSVRDSYNRTYRIDYLLDPKRCPAIWKSKR